MKITLDTNVLVSAFVSKHGHPAKILDIILIFPEVKLILSNQIIEEFENVLSREEVKERFGYSKREIKSFARAVAKVSTIVKVKSHFRVIKEDEKDDSVLNTAYDGKADYIVSGDHHLLNLKKFKGLKIVNPKQMVKIFVSKFGEIAVPEKR